MRGAARAGLLAALVVATFVAPARGFVRGQTEEGIPIYWTSNCVPVTIHLNGFSMMSEHEVAKSIAAAAHTWGPDAVTCQGPDGELSHPYLEIVPGMGAPDADVTRAVNDFRNVVVFIESGWQDDLDHDASAVAVTTLTSKKDGRILDADVEVNAEFATWANIDPGWAGPVSGQVAPFDLQNALTHEFGHFIGLDHTCHPPFATNARPIDVNGNPVPDCSPSLPLEIQQTVMYGTIRGENQETSKRFLSPDDIAAVCAIYPAERNPHVCALDVPDDGCACASAGRSVATTSALLLAALAFLARRRRIS